MADLKIARGFALPLDLVTEATAIVATRGAGKSSASAVIVEEAFRERVQAVVFDRTGVYWGLRSNADGDGPGLGIYVLGGPHGDVPLEATAGALIADLVVDSGHSFVFDLSDFSKAGTIRFAADFLERVYDRKARSRSTTLLIMDEAHFYAPQTPRGGFKGDAARLMGAMEDVVGLGRSRGLGVVLTTQRTQSLNKAVLDLIETLLVMRMLSPRARAAVRDWIQEKHEDDERGVIASLDSLPTGTAWVWSPLRGILEKVALRRIRTFDSYRTPKPGEVLVAPTKRKELDLDALGDRMRATVEKAKADDPKALRRRIKELEAKLTAGGGANADEFAAARARIVALEAERAEVIKALNFRGGLASLAVDSRKLADYAALLSRDFGDRIEGFMHGDGAARSVPPGTEGVHSSAALPDSTASRRQTAEPETNGGSHTPSTLPAGGRGSRQGPGIGAGASSGPSTLPRAAADLAETLAAFPDGLPRERLALLTGRKPRGGSWNTAMKALQELGIAEDRGDVLFPTAKARELYPDAIPLAGAELVQVWRAKLGVAARDVFDALVADGGALTHEELGERTDRAPRGGSWNTAIKQLKTSGLVVEEGRGALRPNPDLMTPA